MASSTAAIPQPPEAVAPVEDIPTADVATETPTNSATTTNTSTTTTQHNPVVVELIYDHLLTSLSTDVALQIHRLLKTGIFPASDLLVPEHRRHVYPPECYQDVEERSAGEASNTNHTPSASLAEVEASCQKYSVECPQRKRRKTLAEQAEDAKHFYGSAYMAESAAFVAHQELELAAAAAEQQQEEKAEKEEITDETMTDVQEEEKEEQEKDQEKEEEETQEEPPVTRGKQPPSGYGTRSKQPLISREKADESTADTTVKPAAPHHGKQPPASRAPHSDQPTKPTLATAASPTKVTATTTPIRATTPSTSTMMSPITPMTTTTTTTMPHYFDIYGHQRPKEPTAMISCHICGRQVNTLRYAPHLDKCLGIGTTVRAAALAASGFVPNNNSNNGTNSTSASSATSSKKKSSKK